MGNKSIYDIAMQEAEPFKPVVGELADNAIFASDFLASESDGNCASIAQIKEFMSVYKQPVDIEHFVQLVRIADLRKRDLNHAKQTKNHH